MQIVKFKTYTSNTRNSLKLHNYKSLYQRTNYVKHTLSNKGVNIWNNLDIKLKNPVSYEKATLFILQSFNLMY